jgi:drug/metabolite transporter (DMT)-like permease
MLQNIKLYGAIILAMIFWAFSFIWTKIAIESFMPVTLVTLRLIIASILLFAYAKATKKFQYVRKEDIKWFVLLAFFEPYLYYMGETYSLTLLSPTLVAVIIATIPLFAPVVAFIMLKEKVSKMNIMGIIISLLGVLLVIYTPGMGLDGSIWGILLVFVAVFAAVFYATTLRKISSYYKTVNIIFYQSLIGLAFFIPTFYITDFSSIATLKISTQSLEALLMLAIFASVLAFVLFAGVVRKIGVAKTNVFVNLIPVFTAVFSFLIFQQYLTFNQWIGIAVVISGLFVSQLAGKKKLQAKIETIMKATEY